MGHVSTETADEGFLRACQKRVHLEQKHHSKGLEPKPCDTPVLPRRIYIDSDS